MNWKSFLTVIFVFFLIFGGTTSCADSQGKGVTVEQLSEAVLKKENPESPYKALGYFKVPVNFYFSKNSPKHPFLALTESELGKKYYKITYKGRKGMFDYYEAAFTEFAKSQGAFIEGKYLFLPIGNVSYTITEQRILEKVTIEGGDQLKVYAKFNVQLNELGKYIQKFAKSLMLSGDLVAVFHRKNSSDDWKYGSDNA